jgi:hypothetical protein
MIALKAIRHLPRFAPFIAIAVCLNLSMAAWAGSLLPGSPVGSDPFVIVFDQNCLARVNQNGMGFKPVTCSILPDPMNGNVKVPTFTLPERVIAGDLLVVDSNGSVGDLVRFPDLGDGTGTANVMLYYSDNADGKDSQSDVGIPLKKQPIIGTVLEDGPEGKNRFIFTAGTLPFANIYRGVSDGSIPEPPSVVLLLTSSLALALLGGARRLVRTRAVSPTAVVSR